MKRKAFISLGLISMFLMGYAANAIAEPALEDVTAQINNTMKLVLNNEDFKPIDPATKREYKPILYNGRTYLPVRAVADAVGLPVNYDEAKDTIYLGTRGKTNLINMQVDKKSHMEPTNDKDKLKIDGKQFDTGIFVDKIAEYNMYTPTYTYINFNLGKKYQKLTFDLSTIGFENDFRITMKNESGLTLKDINFKATDGIKSYEVNVSGIEQLKIQISVDKDKYNYDFNFSDNNKKLIIGNPILE